MKIKLSQLFLSLFLCLNLVAQENASELVMTAMQKSYTEESSGNYRDAINAIKNVKFSNEEQYVKYLRLGWLYYLDKNYKEGLKNYQSALEKETQSIEAREGITNCYYFLQQYIKAEKTAKEILKTQPLDYVARYKLAQLFFINLEYTEAVFHLEKLVKLYPSDYDVNFFLAQCYLLQKNKIKAEQIIATLTYFYPNSADVQTLKRSLNKKKA